MILSTVITLIIGYITWYITLVPLNPHSKSFWFFIIFLILVYGTTRVLIGELERNKSSGEMEYEEVIAERKNKKKLLMQMSLLSIALAVITIVLSISSSRLFNAKRYSEMLEVKEGDFTKDITEISLDHIPVVDRVTAIKLGDRKMGEMVNLASQFNVSNAYTQIDFQDRPVRVTPLEYNGFFKWLNNKSEGIPGYITVDMPTGETTLHKLDKNIKYSKSDRFGRDIARHLTKQYPTKIFYQASFEVDEEGNPYWIAPTYKKTIGIFGGEDVDAVLVANAITGETKEYELDEVPTWIDRVYDADKIIRQIDNWGTLKNGFINNMFSQKGVLKSTKGYNYLAINDDVFLYTGITSASKDNSNVGFMLTNLRTKETKFYEISSADEYSAMESAKGEVQEKEYKSTFPILLNINNKPTYMMALKDNAELIKAYALVDAQNYQKVSVGTTIQQALTKHVGDADHNAKEKLETKEIIIKDISTAVVNGDTQYYLKTEDDMYIASIKASTELPFISTDKPIKVSYYIDKDGNKKIENLVIE